MGEACAERGRTAHSLVPELHSDASETLLDATDTLMVRHTTSAAGSVPLQPVCASSTHTERYAFTACFRSTRPGGRFALAVRPEGS